MPHDEQGPARLDLEPMNQGRTEPRSRRSLLLAGLGLVALLGLLAWMLRQGEHEATPTGVTPGATPDAGDRAARAADDLGVAIAESASSDRKGVAKTSPEGKREPAADAVAAATGALTVVTGLAVDEEGRPLSRASFDWIVLPIRIDSEGQELVSGSGPKGSAATNETGRFEIEMKRPKKHERGFLELSLTTPSTQGRCRIECIELPRCDVGIVRLAESPILIGGIVVDTDGKPIAGAFLTMVDRAHAMGSDAARTGVLPRGRTGEDGRFALRGYSRAQKLTFWVHHDQHESEARESVPVPVKDLRIVLARSTMPFVRVRLLRDPIDCTEGLMVWLHHAKLQKDRFWMLPAGPDVWELPRLTPGQCEIEITACGESLIKIGNVDVPPSGPSLDPRLDGVDLRRRLECVRVQLVSESGEPVPRGRVSVGGWTHLADEAGDIALVRPIGSKIVVTDCMGARVELVEGLKLCAAR